MGFVVGICVMCGGEKRGFDLKITLNPDVQRFCAGHIVLFVEYVVQRIIQKSVKCERYAA